MEVLQLSCAAQNYEWGLLGQESLVARIHGLNTGRAIDGTKPYAELWMGTHPNAPSFVKQADGGLAELRAVLGKDLPFLFKILSVKKALSIQAHPDKQLAERLFSEFPDVYKDPNHKPEIAIALTDFEALCGFRPVDEIAALVAKYPEFASLVSAESVMALQQSRGCALKSFFTELMSSNPGLVATKTKHLMDRIGTPKDSLERLFFRLNTEYPDDIGCFCVFVLNYVTMKPGECIFMGANEPHAYLRGECIECMALSDNVVRAGLTPKFRDVKTLCGMLTYDTYTHQELFTEPKSITKHSVLYKAPVTEFGVVKTEFDSAGTESICRPHETMILVLQGTISLSGAAHGAGSILLVPAGMPFELAATEPALLYQAFQP